MNTQVLESRFKSQLGLRLIKEGLLEYVSMHAEGVAHSKIVSDLGLESNYEGRQKNYLSFSVLGLLVNEGHVRYEKRGRNKVYIAN
jgi:hypothetical protein